MKLILNELSIPEQVTKLESFVKDILNVTLQLSLNKFDNEQLKLHIPNSFLTSDFGTQFYTHVYSNYDVDNFSLFNSLIDCPPTESIIKDFESSGKSLHKVTLSFKNQEIEGIGLKASTYYLNKRALYSLNSDSYWDNTTLKTKSYLSKERFVHNELINFSSPALFPTGHRALIGVFLKNIGWKPSVSNFPFAKQASDCYRESCMAEIAKCKDSQEKISVYRNFGELFAAMNGYTLDDDLCKINTNDGKIRDIYSAGNSNHMRFISIDIENGGFEFCDHDGTHLGTYGWLGDKISDAKIRTHSIKLRS